MIKSFQPFDLNGKQHMEYFKFRGDFDAGVDNEISGEAK